MPLVLEPIDLEDKWVGFNWIIEDEDALAKLIATVAMGQSRHVEKILTGETDEDAIPVEAAKAGAIKLLTVTNPKDPYNRDGWLFQVVSWIAAVLASDDNVIVHAPQMIQSLKGFDGFHIEVDGDTGDVIAAVIHEDKATENPRRMVRDKVWPDFAALESGAEHHLLVSETESLLATRPEINIDTAIRKIIWNEARAYRVSVTISDKENSKDGHKALFKGYSKIAPGDAVRRGAEVLHVQKLRDWLAALADSAINEINAMEAGDV